MPPRTGPLDEQTLMLAGYRAFGSVGTYGGEPQERIERQTAQGPGMGPEAQLPLREPGGHGQRQPQRTRHREHRQAGMGRIEPHESRGGHQELGGPVDELAAQGWPQTP